MVTSEISQAFAMSFLDIPKLQHTLMRWIQPAAMDGGAFSLTILYSSDFIMTWLHTSIISFLLSFEQNRTTKSYGLDDFVVIFIISWNFLQPFVMVVMFRLNIFAISLALLGTSFVLHDM